MKESRGSIDLDRKLVDCSEAGEDVGGSGLLAQHRVEEACHLGPDRRLRPVGGQPLDQRRRLDEGVVRDPRHRGMAAATVDDDTERGAHLLGRRAQVERVAPKLDALAAALVDRVVHPNRVRMLIAEPLEPEVVPDLLVCGRDEDQVAGRLEALARQRRNRHGARRDLILHVERSAPPDVVVGEVAGPRVARPLVGIGDDRVRVREEAERRPVAALEARDEVGPLRRARIELDLDAVRLEVVAQELRRDRLVPRRVDRVQPQELLEQADRLVLQAHAFCCSCERAVSSLRTRQSSGKKT